MLELREFLQEYFGYQPFGTIWPVGLWQFVSAFIVLFIGFVSRKVIIGVSTGRLKRRAETSNVQWDNNIIELMPKPVGVTIQISFWWLAITILELPVDIAAFIFGGFKVAIAFAVTWVVFRAIDVFMKIMERAATKTESLIDDQAVPLLRKTFKVFLGITVGVLVVEELGYSVTTLITSLGIGGLALALAAKDTLANVFGSVVVFADRPFQVGDLVEFDGIKGSVEEIGFRTTRIRRPDKALVTVPNQKLTTSAITNFNRREKRRLSFVVGLGYTATATQVESFVEQLKKLLDEHDTVEEGSPLVNLSGFGDSALEVTVFCFIARAGWSDFMAAQQDLLLKIMKIVEDLGVEFAFPSQTVYLRQEQDWNAQPE